MKSFHEDGKVLAGNITVEHKIPQVIAFQKTGLRAQLTESFA